MAFIGIIQKDEVLNLIPFFFMYWEKIKKVDQENGKEMQDYDP